MVPTALWAFFPERILEFFQRSRSDRSDRWEVKLKNLSEEKFDSLNFELYIVLATSIPLYHHRKFDTYLPKNDTNPPSPPKKTCKKHGFPRHFLVFGRQATLSPIRIHWRSTSWDLWKMTGRRQCLSFWELWVTFQGRVPVVHFRWVPFRIVRVGLGPLGIQVFYRNNSRK